MHCRVELLVADEVVKTVEGLVVGNQREFAKFVSDRDPSAREVRRVLPLWTIAGEQGGDFERGVGEIARTVLRAEPWPVSRWSRAG